MRDQSGSVFIYIFVGIVLFGGLMFALNRSGQVSTSVATKGLAKASAADLQEYSRMVGSAVDMLLSRGCSQSQISYETPSGLGVNSNAPSDKSCHVFNIAGGNIRYRDLGSGFCVSGKLTTQLSIGENCGSFIYAGLSGGNRIYAALSDQGSLKWSNLQTVTGVTNDSDGKSNTDSLLSRTDTTYPAALACRALGEKWYLPARFEMYLLYDNRNTGAFSGTFSEVNYLGSSESSQYNAKGKLFNSVGNNATPNKLTATNVRCIRRD